MISSLDGVSDERVGPVSLPVSTQAARSGPGGQAVQFYKDDEYVASSVARFVEDAIRRGSSALVIATRKHVVGIEGELRVAGVTLPQPEAGPTCLFLDADETLASVCKDGHVDEARFAAHLGLLVARLTANGRPLAAFVEMVALLWAQGRSADALRLEQCWSSLSRRHPLDLRCAYPLRGFANTCVSQHFQRICQAHTRVIPAETYFPQEGLSDDQLRQIAALQQRAAALEHEIAERKRVEADLRQRERQLTAFFETAPIGLHWVDAHGVVVWANQAELDLLGYTHSEYVGHSVSEFHVDQQVIGDMLARLSRGETLKDFPARLRCKDGGFKTVLIDSNVLWENGRFVHTQCFTRDVTRQREIEQMDRHMAAIIDGTDDAIISKTLDGRITSWNPGAERLFGYAREEVLGKPITILIPEDRLSEETMIISRLRNGERLEHYETVRRRSDGSLLEVSLTISPVRDANGKVVGASKIARDISEKNAAAKALEIAKDRLARMNEELEEHVRQRTASLTDLLTQMETFSYTVSHDLRAPLRAMAEYARALEEDYGSRLDDEARRYIARIIRASDRMSRMINDVLAYARVNRDRLDLKPLSLRDCIDNLMIHADELQPPKAIVTIAENAPAVIGNEAFVTQIFANLLGNAVKFVPAGRIPVVEISFHRRAEKVRVDVVDNGIGIKPEYQHRLFGLFERLQADQRYDGTGIGLAIVRRAAERMGGTVGVESDGTNGSRFWIELPAAE